MRKSLNNNQDGMILTLIMILLPLLLYFTYSFLTLTLTSFSTAKQDQMFTTAQLAADAGIDAALFEISENESWTGTSATVTLQNNNNIKSTYDVIVTNIDADNKLVTATGKTYFPENSASPKITKIIKAKLRAVRSGGNYSVVTGVGGLYMSNSAKILGGDVLVNGEISMTNSSQIGLTNNTVNVYVAHQICPYPADSTYPRVCNSGERGQPISLTNSSKIYGTVKANNQTNGSGMLNPGLVESSGVIPGTMPTHDRDAQKAAAVNSLTGSQASCSSGTKTWPANVKITGNVNISNTCQVTLSGDAWVTGNFNMSNSSKLVVPSSVGTTRPNIMVDGTSTNFSNSSTIVSNNQQTGAQVITYWSSASCSPNCTNVTGVDLNNSRNTSTITLNNSSSGPNTVFYARWSRVNIVNSGQLGALIGQTIQLSNSGTITFGTTVNPGSGQAFWILAGYQRDI